MITFGLITVSDSCYEGIKTDEAGKKLEEEIKKQYPDSSVLRNLVPDDRQQISQALKEMIFSKKLNVIFTIGGTGFSPRDVTPEATREIIEKPAPGLMHIMMAKSLVVTDYAVLSRAVCGIADKSIILNFPGSTKACVECFQFVQKPLQHAVDLVIDKKDSIIKQHNSIQKCVSKVSIDNPAGRIRISPYPMLEVDDAVKIVLKQCKQIGDIEEVSINNSLSRILAEKIVCKEPIPQFDASIKDGYAVKAADGDGVRVVRSVVNAGNNPISTLNSGEVIRISTGAPIPPGADSVIQVEDTEVYKTSQDGLQELEVKINVAPKLGQDIRRQGSELAEGDLALEKDNVITAAHIGVMAMLGFQKVKVYKRAAVAVISTGDELCPANQPLKPGQIRDSNKIFLINLLKQYNFVANDCGIAKDHPNDVLSTLAKAFDSNDIVITTGGVSMGERDLIKKVLVEDFQATIHFGRINMKPGKPTTFAELKYNRKTKFVFGLPGNPASTGVTCILFVLPAIRCIEKHPSFMFPVIKSTLKHAMTNKDVRPEYVRGCLTFSNGKFECVSTGNQISSRVNSLVNANALLIFPPKTECPGNEEFDTIVFGDLKY